MAYILELGEEKPERRGAMKSDGIAHELDRRPLVLDLPDEMRQKNQKGQYTAAPQVQSWTELTVYP